MFRARRTNGIDLPYDMVAALRAAYQTGNLQDFLNIYYRGAHALFNEEDFYGLTRPILAGT